MHLQGYPEGIFKFKFMKSLNCAFSNLIRVATANSFSILYVTLFTLFLLLISIFRADGSIGYDGDTIILASQFIKLINLDIYASFDLGTNPKPLIMIIGGISYLLFDNLILLNLTFFISFLIMLLRLGSILGDYRFVSLGLLLLASNPFLLTTLFGADASLLYLILLTLSADSLIFRRNYKHFLFLISLAWLARPGVETVLFGAFILDLIERKHKRAIFTLGFALTLTALSLNVWRLSYDSYSMFQTLVYGGVKESLFHTFDAPLLDRLLFTFNNSFLALYDFYKIPTNLGLLVLAISLASRLRPQVAKMIFLIACSIITALGATLITGINHITTHKMSELSIMACVAVLGSQLLRDLHSNLSERFLNKLNVVAIFLALAGITAYGQLSKGKYEIALDGSGAGELGWLSLAESRERILGYFPDDHRLKIRSDKDSITFTTLDYGMRADRIDLVTMPISDLDDTYDLYILRNQEIEVNKNDWKHLSYKEVNYYLNLRRY